MKSWFNVHRFFAVKRLRALQKDLAQIYATPTDNTATVSGAMQERIWAQVAATLPQKTPVLKPAKSWLSSDWLGGACLVAVAATCVFAILVKPHLATTEAGIKAGASDVIHMQTPNLRFALVGEDQTISRGTNGMTVPAGVPLIFSVESEAVPAAGIAITLAYKTPGGETKVLTEGYLIRKGLSYIEGKNGFIAFTPQETGLYTFFLSNQATFQGKQVAFAGGTHAGRFTVSIVE